MQAKQKITVKGEIFKAKDTFPTSKVVTADLALALEEQRDELLEALKWLHPKAGTWRTPDNEKAEAFEALISKVTGDKN